MFSTISSTPSVHLCSYILVVFEEIVHVIAIAQIVRAGRFAYDVPQRGRNTCPIPLPFGPLHFIRFELIDLALPLDQTLLQRLQIVPLHLFDFVEIGCVRPLLFHIFLVQSAPIRIQVMIAHAIGSRDPLLKHCRALAVANLLVQALSLQGHCVQLLFPHAILLSLRVHHITFEQHLLQPPLRSAAFRIQFMLQHGRALLLLLGDCVQTILPNRFFHFVLCPYHFGKIQILLFVQCFALFPLTIPVLSCDQSVLHANGVVQPLSQHAAEYPFVVVANLRIQFGDQRTELDQTRRVELFAETLELSMFLILLISALRCWQRFAEVRLWRTFLQFDWRERQWFRWWQ